MLVTLRPKQKAWLQQRSKDGIEDPCLNSMLALVCMGSTSPENREDTWCTSALGSHSEILSKCSVLHRYTAESTAIRYFLEVISELDSSDQRRFLRFVTGSPRLPPGGIAALQPRCGPTCSTPMPSTNPVPEAVPQAGSCTTLEECPVQEACITAKACTAADALPLAAGFLSTVVLSMVDHGGLGAG